MIKVTLMSNAKTIDGTPVPFFYYENDVYIVEKTHRTYIIRCKQYEVEVEVYQEAIKDKQYI